MSAFSSSAVYFPYHGTAAASSSAAARPPFLPPPPPLLLFRAAAVAAATAAAEAAEAAAASFASLALEWISRVRSEPVLVLSSGRGPASWARAAAVAAAEAAPMASRRSARAAAPAAVAAWKWSRQVSKRSELVRCSWRLIWRWIFERWEFVVVVGG